jgi:hypothetical protein
MEAVMFTYKGGDTVKGGFYWNRGTWHLENVEGKRGTLSGSGETRYLWIPTLLMLILAPVMGGLFVLFLPFVGFALLFSAAGRWAVAHVRKATAATAGSPVKTHARKAV